MPVAENPVWIFASLLGAGLLASLTLGDSPLDNLGLSGVDGGYLVWGPVSAITSICLCAYATWLASRRIQRTHAIKRLLESQLLLGKFSRAFDDNLTTDEFAEVATRVLSEFCRHFGAEALRIEIVEPRTGVTVEEYLSGQFPPAIKPEAKANFLEAFAVPRTEEEQVGGYFLDHKNRSADLLVGNRKAEIAAAVRTPLGRVAILVLTYNQARRSFGQDEISLLCSTLSGLIQTASDHCRRRNRQDLERRLSHAERVQAVGTLAGGVAHEFNNILGALLGFGELALQRAREGECVEHYLNEIISTSKRAEFIVNQILALSRNHQNERCPINLVEAVQDALPLISASLPDLQINTHLVPDEDCKFIGHPVELQQIIMNLCKNACEASQGDITVGITVDTLELNDVQPLLLGLLPPGKYVRICVSDNGIGISSDALPHIFEPFFTTKATTGGTGLGLAAVHGLVTAMTGRINVVSDGSNGATFEVYFPHSQLSPTAIGQFFSTSWAASGRGELIALLVPDHCDLGMHEDKIAALGYEPAGFSDIDHLEAWLSTQTPHLIVVDVRSIPSTHSARTIEIMAGAVPVLFITYSGNEAILNAAASLRSNFLRGPLSTRALADGIKGAI